MKRRSRVGTWVEKVLKGTEEFLTQNRKKYLKEKYQRGGCKIWNNKGTKRHLLWITREQRAVRENKLHLERGNVQA